MTMCKKVTTLLIALLLIAGFVPGVFAGGQQDSAAAVEENILKIGVLGVMTGPAASWGLVNKYCTEAMAQIYNEDGGVEIDGEMYKIEVITIDTKQDPKIAVTGAERLVSEGVRYVVGPNVDNTAISVAGVFEDAGVMYMPYSFNHEIYSPPRENAILGMIASYQTAPVMYSWLMKNRGVKTVAFVARNQPDPLNQRRWGVEKAKELGLEILSWKDTYEANTQDFNPVMSKVIRTNPDLIVLSGASPGDAPHLINAAREQGYKGILSEETVPDINILNEVAGKNAVGFIYLGGSTAPAIETDYMRRFRKVYAEIAGEWNTEAGTKVYALPAYVWGLQEAGKEALTDVEVFKKAIPNVSVKNPFVKGGPEWTFVGQEDFGQLRQVQVPMVVMTVVEGGKEEPLFIGAVGDY